MAHPEAETTGTSLEGFIEIFGRHDAADYWVFGGWISPAWMESSNRAVTATFDRGLERAEAQVAFYTRADLGSRGIGFIAVLPSKHRRLGALRQLDFHHEDPPANIKATKDVRELTGAALLQRADAILRSCSAGAATDAISAVLGRRYVGEGYLDVYGYHVPSAGWFICGWLSNDWIEHAAEPGEVVAQFEAGATTGAAVMNFYDREDIRGKGLGFILHLSTHAASLGRLVQLTLRAGDAVAVARASRVLEMIPGDSISEHILGLIVSSDHGAARVALQELASRAAHDGRDTIDKLAGRIFIEFDEAIHCPPDSVLLFGWLLARPGAIAAARLRCGTQIFPIDLQNGFLWIDRPDVIDTIGREYGFDDARCGFVARVPTPQPVSGDLYLEVETDAGETGFKTVPKSRLDGVPAIKRLLSAVETQYTEVDAIFDAILGPAIAALNVRRLQSPPRIQALQLGPAVAATRHSVIVPLYGRIDFMEMQMAHFATLGIGTDVEIIYVLDDPPLTRETQFLAASVYERFRVPFRLLCLTRNVGFAPANNVGLRAARGDTICFMNSDVFPASGDWLDRLAAHLHADPKLGVVGPVLLFEDDSVQHQGIAFKQLPQYGNWAFPQHKRKGFRLPGHADLVREVAITGACMLLRRDHAEACGGFDEQFIIGDFEDTDLCLKLAAAGFYAAVDFGVRMYHLERKSQAGSAHTWRTNLTIYNAWRHQRRWQKSLERMQVLA